jgi:hypothetical protein
MVDHNRMVKKGAKSLHTARNKKMRITPKIKLCIFSGGGIMGCGGGDTSGIS